MCFGFEQCVLQCYLNVNALIGRELSGFICTRSLTMNEKFQYRTRPPSIIQIEYGTAKNSSKFESAEAMVIMKSRRSFRHNPVSHGTNQAVRKSEFLQ